MARYRGGNDPYTHGNYNLKGDSARIHVYVHKIQDRQTDRQTYKFSAIGSVTVEATCTNSYRLERIQSTYPYMYMYMYVMRACRYVSCCSVAGKFQVLHHTDEAQISLSKHKLLEWSGGMHPQEIL